MAQTYTDAQIEELKSVPKLNYELAQIFADKHGIGVRSVIAKAKSLEIPYETKAPGDKKKSAVKKKTKADLIKEFYGAYYGPELPSLTSMTVTDLEKLTNYLIAVNATDA